MDVVTLTMKLKAIFPNGKFNLRKIALIILDLAEALDQDVFEIVESYLGVTI